MRMFKKKVPKDAKLLVVNLTHLTGYNLGPKHAEVFVDVTVLRAGNYIPSRSGKIPRTEALPINCGASEIPFFKVFVWDIERSVNPQEVTISVRLFKRRRPKWRRRYFGETYVECPGENEEVCRSDTIEGRHPRRQPECEYYVCTFDVCLLESDFMTEEDPFYTPRSSLASPLDDYLVGVNSQESPIAWDPVEASQFMTRHWTDGGVTKAPGNYQLYDVVHVDLLKQSRLPWPPPLNAHTTWDPESKVPRVVSIRLNYQQGHNLVQLAVMTHIRPEAIEALKGSPEHAGMLPALHLLRRLWEAKGQLPCEQPSSANKTGQ